LVEKAGFHIGFDQPVKRQDRREQRRHPDHPRPGPRQQPHIGAHRKRIKHRDGQEEQQWQSCPAAPARPAEQQRAITPKDQAELAQGAAHGR